jgi:hypothetical protein
VLGNNQPADFAGAVPSTIFAFQHHNHHHLKYDGLSDCIVFSSFAKQPFPGSDETVEDNRCFDERIHNFSFAVHWPLKYLELGI